VTIETAQPCLAANPQPRVLERREHPVSRGDIDPRVLKVLYRLINGGHTAYLVGGGVRDLMMGRRPKDFDVATSAHPQQVRDLFRNSRLIGRRFRLVHVFFGAHNIEVATFRRLAQDVAQPDDLLIRHDNTFGTAAEDAFRRDFTVNSLFYDPRTFRVIDYTGGVADLEARLIRTIGDPELRMREDPVRMLRAVRFAAKLGFEIEPATRAAIERHREDLLKASVPRVVEEIYRALGIAAAARALALMCELGLLDVLMPPLADFLRAAADGPFDNPTIRNLTAMGRRIGAGTEPTHSLVLSCLFADFNLHRIADGAPVDLPAELRLRGFARADAERMRLVLDALPHLISPSRRTRRIAQRPYFAEARTVFEVVASNCGGDSAVLENFLRDPDAHVSSPGGDGEREPVRRGRRRRHRGRRGGRWRRARHGRGSSGTVGEATQNGAPGSATEARQTGPSGAGDSEGPPRQ
jgi:poly(A) polymerase